MITRPPTQVQTRLWRGLYLIGLIGLVNCTNVPELDATIPDHLRNADYPKLVRLDGVFATAQNPREQADKIEQSLETRRRQLQSRARRLQNSPE